MVCREKEFPFLHHRGRWIFKTYGTQRRGNIGGGWPRKDLPGGIPQDSLGSGSATGRDDGSSPGTFLTGGEILSGGILRSFPLAAIKGIDKALEYADAAAG